MLDNINQRKRKWKEKIQHLTSRSICFNLFWISSVITLRILRCRRQERYAEKQDIWIWEIIGIKLMSFHQLFKLLLMKSRTLKQPCDDEEHKEYMIKITFIKKRVIIKNHLNIHNKTITNVYISNSYNIILDYYI